MAGGEGGEARAWEMGRNGEGKGSIQARQNQQGGLKCKPDPAFIFLTNTHLLH